MGFSAFWTCLWPTIGSAGVLFGSVYKSFSLLEVNLSPATKRDISNVLYRRDSFAALRDLPIRMYHVFLEIYGNNHFARVCFKRSITITFFALLLTFSFSIINH
jgi:hypothetical protein